MDRRSAIKLIGIGFGASVTMGGLMSTLVGCKNDVEGEGKADALFLTDANHRALVQRMVDLILPKTDTPSASEVGVVEFVDASVAQLYEQREQELFKAGLEGFIKKLEKTTGATFNKASDEQLLALLDAQIGSKANPEEHQKAMRYFDVPRQLSDFVDKPEYLVYGFANAIKGLAINGYFGSEIIGEKHLNYLPVPGPYQGCVDYDGGAAYSLN